MSIVIADISMSLDGYVTARGADRQHGLGVGGEAIHGWVLEDPRSPVDEAVLASSFAMTGAVVMGRGCMTSSTARTAGTTTSGTGMTRTSRPRRRATWLPTNRPPRCGSRPGSGS